MIQLHFAPSTACMIPHILLEELGVPYQRVPVDKQNDGHKAPAASDQGLDPGCVAEGCCQHWARTNAPTPTSG